MEKKNSVLMCHRSIWTDGFRLGIPHVPLFFTGLSILPFSKVPLFLYIFLKSIYKWSNKISFLFHIYLLFVFMKDRCKSEIKMDYCLNLTLMQTQIHLFCQRKKLHCPLYYIFLLLDVSLDSNKSIFIYHIYKWMKFYLLWFGTCLKKFRGTQIWIDNWYHRRSICYKTQRTLRWEDIIRWTSYFNYV